MNHRFTATIVLSFLFYIGIFSSPSLAAQGEYPTCAPNTSCNLGEFLYDDEYAPIVTADCRLTSRAPNGDVFVNSAPMSAQVDGWYSLSVGIGSTEGIYRTQICCTAGTDYLCLDKTFQVKTESSGTSLTADEVWDHPTRTLTSFGTLPEQVWSYTTRTVTGYGTLVADIWGYNNKSLSNFGTLVTDIWSTGTRTVTGGTITTTTNLSALETKINRLININAENRQLLEQLVNKPIVNTFIDQGPTNLQSKLEKSQNTANSLYSSIQNLRSRTELLDSKWNDLSPPEIQAELDTLNQILKDDLTKDNSSIISHTNWLKQAWNSPLTLNLSDQASAAQSKIENLKNDLSLFGKKDHSAFKLVISHTQQLDTLLGTSLNTSSNLTLFGYLKKITKLASTLDQQTTSANNLLTQINTSKPKDLEQNINDISADVMTINLIPNAHLILDPPLKDDKNYHKNKILNLLALVDTNRLLLTGNAGKAVGKIWLGEGSIIFRAVTINPSKIISQKVPIEIDLPEEIQKENIINSDPNLKIVFNTDKNQLVATGEIELSPEETKTYLVEVEDIWQFSESELNSIKKQAEDLTTTTINTAYYAQSLSLKSDINVTLEKVISRQKEAITPENRIQTYRESRLEIAGVGDKMTGLKDLATQAGSSHNLFGFVGGVQAIAVWGLIIIIIAGFVFFSLYMRALKSEPNIDTNHKTKPEPIKTEDLPPHFHHSHLIPNKKRVNARRFTFLIITIMLTSGFGSLGTSLSARESHRPVNLISPLVSDINTQTLGVTTNHEFPTLTIPSSKTPSVHENPNSNSPITSTLKPNQTIYIYEKQSNWARIGLTKDDNSHNWWINTDTL
jgi:hypothetical protein